MMMTGEDKSKAHTYLRLHSFKDLIKYRYNREKMSQRGRRKWLFVCPRWMLLLNKGREKMNVMPIRELIEQVERICRKNGVRRLDLFGSFATGTALPTSDIDFVVYGCGDILKLEKDLEEIDTLRKIDIFDYDSIRNEYLLEDIQKYGKQIY